MFRDLLVHVDGSESGRRRVKVAGELAKRFGARLGGLHVTPPAEVPPRFKPSLVAEVFADLSSRLDLDASASATVFNEEATQCLPDTCWFETVGDVVQGIREKARYADLVILGQYEWQGSPETHPLPIAHSVVLQCGRPVLVIPAIATSSVLAKIVIAWDGSREAVRAVHDALPLLRMAATVQIVTIVHPSAENNGTDTMSLSVHLDHHGIKVSPEVLQIRTTDEHESVA